MTALGNESRRYCREPQYVMYAREYMLILQNNRFILYTVFVKLERMSCMVLISVIRVYNMASVYTCTVCELIVGMIEYPVRQFVYP